MNRKHYSKAVRELVHFRGMPDPLRGDSLNQKVRDTAREAAEALADQSSQREMNTARAPTRGRIEGFGSETNAAHSAPWDEDPGRTSGGTMEGFGRDGPKAFEEKRPATLSSGLSSFKEWGAGLRSSQVSKWKSGSSLAGQAFSDEPSVGTSYRPYTEVSPVGPVSSAQSGTAADGLVEKQMVESICAAGGVRLEPTPEVAKRFFHGLNSLDPVGVNFVLETLDIKVTSESPAVAYRALFAIEQAIQSNGKYKDTFCQHYREYPDLVLQHRTSRNASLQGQSMRTAVALGLESGATPPRAGHHAPPQREMGDLLGDFGEDQGTERKEDPAADLLSLDAPANEQQMKPVASRESVTSAPERSEHALARPSHEIADLLGQLTTEHPGASSELQAGDQQTKPAAVGNMQQGARGAYPLPDASTPRPPPPPQLPDLFMQPNAQVAPAAIPGMVPFPRHPTQTGQLANPMAFDPYHATSMGQYPNMMSQSAVGMQVYQQATTPYTGQASYAQGYHFNGQASAMFYPQSFPQTGGPQPYILPESSSNGNNTKPTGKKNKSPDSIPEFDFISQHINSEIKKS